MRYFDLYLAGLYDALQVGGQQETIDKTVTEINNPTPAGLAAWLKYSAPMPCPTCGTTFVPTTDVKLNQEVLCETCAKPPA